MLKKFAFALIPISMSFSVAFADTSNPIQLTPEQMDQVTAGIGAIAITSSTADSPFYALTGSQAAAITAVSGGLGNAALGGGYVEVAGGDAAAAAAGAGATTSTNVAAGTSTAGWNGTTTLAAGGSFKGSLVEFSGGIVLTAGSLLLVNPFQ